MNIEELCAKLQQKRNELGLTLEEVVEKTKLYPSVIRDIEACNLGNINKAYLKGYIKIYASFLSVDVEDALGKISLNEPGVSQRQEVKVKPPVQEKPKLKLSFKSIPVISERACMIG